MLKGQNLKSILPKKDIEALIDLFDVYGEIVDVKSKVELCRDSKDNFLLSLAKDSRAHYLITGDEDLLSLKKIGRAQILSISSYLEKS